MKPPKTLKWYGMHCEKKDFSRSKVYTWTSEPIRLNSSFPRIASCSLCLQHPPPGCTCNQAAHFIRCLTKVQENMLARRDSYLEFLKAGIKQDTLMSLRTAPIHTSALFPDHIISKAEKEICHHEDKRTSNPLHKKPQPYHLYSQATRQQQDSDQEPKQIRRRGQRSNSGKAQVPEAV